VAGLTPRAAAISLVFLARETRLRVCELIEKCKNQRPQLADFVSVKFAEIDLKSIFSQTLRTLFSAAVSLDSHCFTGPVTVFASAIGPVPRSMLFSVLAAQRPIFGILSSLLVEN
jgi:hypothetical protein